MKYHIDKKDDMLNEIISACYPEYRGRKISISTSILSQLNSYWSGGSITYYKFYHLDTKQILPVESNHPYFERNNPRDLPKLPERLIIVSHVIFCGKDMSITIYANAEDMTPLIEDKPDISEDEKMVLFFTRAYKSSYAGISNYRLYEAKRYGMTEDRWNSAREKLISKKLLNKRGAITPNGRNAAPNR